MCVVASLLFPVACSKPGNLDKEVREGSWEGGKVSPTRMSQDKPWPRMPSLSAGRLFTLPAAAQGLAAHSSLPGHPLSPVTMAPEWFLPNILQPFPLPHPCIHCKASWLLSGLCRGCSLTPCPSPLWLGLYFAVCVHPQPTWDTSPAG